MTTPELMTPSADSASHQDHHEAPGLPHGLQSRGTLPQTSTTAHTAVTCQSAASIKRATSQRFGRVRVPWRVVASPSYPDVALPTYVKVAALGRRPEGCTAGVLVLAGYLGTSPSSVERGLRALSRPDPRDGVVELLSRRRSLPGGRGTTAVRRVRVADADERFVWIPVAAAESLDARELRAYAALAYAVAMRIPVTDAWLGGVLVHHSGKRAGEPIGAAAAGAVRDALEQSGWVDVQRRVGLQGRHMYVVHDLPCGRRGLHEDDLTADEVDGAGNDVRDSLRCGDGSGSPVCDGSLASKDDCTTDRHEARVPDPPSPAAGGLESRTREKPVDNSAGTPETSAGGALRADDTPKSPDEHNAPKTPPQPTGDSAGKQLAQRRAVTFEPLVAWVLEPVRWVLRQVQPYVQRRAAAEVRSQLADGVEAERLRQRLLLRFGGVVPSEITNPAGWLLGVGLVRWGCYDPRCESGVRWFSGEACQVCAGEREHRRQMAARATEAAQSPTAPQPACRCPRCGLYGGTGQVCALCRTLEEPRNHPTESGPVVTATASPRSERCSDCASSLHPLDTNQRCLQCALEVALQDIIDKATAEVGRGLLGRANIEAVGRVVSAVRTAAHREREDHDCASPRDCYQRILAEAQRTAEGLVAAAGPGPGALR